MLALSVRLRLCFALLRICDECRDCGDFGDIHGFIDIYCELFVILTCMFDDDDDDVEMQTFVLFGCASPSK